MLILLPIEIVAACRTSTSFYRAHEKQNTELIGGIIKNNPNTSSGQNPLLSLYSHKSDSTFT